MPRYEPYKSRYKGNYTRQIKNESKEINLKKPLIISVVFIISAAVIFSVIKNYAPMVDIAIKDFFSINHREAVVLGSDGMEESPDKLSFLSNIPLFSFFIKSDTNQTLSVMAYETNSMLETTLSDNQNLTNSTSINRESLLPFFNENFNTNYYNSSIYRENQNQNISENIESVENNNIDNNEENQPYNYIQQMIIESGRNNENNSVNNLVNNTNNNSARNNNSINNINNISNNSSNYQTSSIFQDILKPKENAGNIIKTMKPASTGFSSEVPSYMQNNNYNNNNNNINNGNNTKNNLTNNYNNFFKDIEDKNENLNNNNNRERIINYSPQRDNRKEEKNNNANNNNISRKNIIEETIFNNDSKNASDYQRVINDMINPNQNNIVRDNNRNNSGNNNLNNNANNINNAKRNENKEEIMKKAKTDVANYKRRKANNISRDFNNIKTKSKDEGIYLVEYDENSGAITLIFRNRNFNDNVSIESAIKTLLNGATDDENNKNIISCIPRNTELLDIFVEDDIVYLNFNEDFEFNPLGNEGTMIQIYQLVYTATQFEGIDKVIFLINGNLNETIGAEGSIENTAFTRF